MANLQLTKKLHDRLKVPLTDIIPENYNAIENYHCNLLKIGKENCLLITNDTTLFSFVICGLKANDFKNFSFIVREQVFKILLGLEFTQKEIEKVLTAFETIRFSQTHNRSVLSHMNDMRWQIESSIIMGDALYITIAKLNRTPYLKLKGYAIDLYRELL
jgi:hypothetical protein